MMLTLLLGIALSGPCELAVQRWLGMGQALARVSRSVACVQPLLWLEAAGVRDCRDTLKLFMRRRLVRKALLKVYSRIVVGYVTCPPLPPESMDYGFF